MIRQLCVAAIFVPVMVLAAGEVKEGKKFHRLTLGGKVLKVEIAENEEDRRRGLMFRRSLGANEGMLFIFPDESRLSFWMKNTFIPLDIGFFDKDRRLVDIQSMAPAKSEMQTELPSYESAAPAMYALEVNQGWFKKHKIKLGEKFTLERDKP